MGVHEGTAVFLVGNFMERDPKADLLSKIKCQSSSRRSSRCEDTLTSFFLFMNYLVKLYAENTNISRIDLEIIGLETLPNQCPYFKEHLW